MDALRRALSGADAERSPAQREQDATTAIERVREVADYLRASDERISDLEARLEAATERARQAEGRLSAEAARADEAELRAREADERLGEIMRVIQEELAAGRSA